MTRLQAAKLARQPGGEFLSDKETGLCELLSLSPMQVKNQCLTYFLFVRYFIFDTICQYLQCKELILRESTRLGGLSREGALRMVKVELHQNYGSVYDFAVSRSVFILMFYLSSLNHVFQWLGQTDNRSRFASSTPSWLYR